MDDLKRLALKMKMYKVEGTPVHHTALCYLYLLRRNIPDLRVVAGWAVSSGEVCRHYWVEDGAGVKYDIAYELACLYNPDLKLLLVETSHQKPEGYRDMDSTETVNSNLCEDFVSNPRKFWQECPASVKRFASYHLKQ